MTFNYLWQKTFDIYLWFIFIWLLVYISLGFPVMHSQAYLYTVHILDIQYVNIIQSKSFCNNLSAYTTPTLTTTLTTTNNNDNLECYYQGNNKN